MPYPSIQPFATGALHVEHGAAIYWEASGNPVGHPALYLHGGPGSGLGAGHYRRHFDPERYLVVGMDQRGCGRSRPLVTDSLATLHLNTTSALIGDIESVRRHLGIDTWLVSGVSWGTTLALAYAQQHPERVTDMVLVAVTTTSRREIEWITGSIGCLFPEAWSRFVEEADALDGERIVDAYARRLARGGAEDRERAARSWNDWEDVHVSLDPKAAKGGPRRDALSARAFATLVTHYWSNDGFLLGARAIAARMERIAHCPSVLIHGRHDIGSPAVTAWDLHRRWPASCLTIVETEGHGGPDCMALMSRACDDLTGRRS